LTIFFEVGVKDDLFGVLTHFIENLIGDFVRVLILAIFDGIFEID